MTDYRMLLSQAGEIIAADPWYVPALSNLSALLMDSLFLGMICAFTGLLFADIKKGLPGFIPIAVALVSMILMAFCGLLIRKCHVKWLEQYALPFCMLGGMLAAIPLTTLMGGAL